MWPYDEDEYQWLSRAGDEPDSDSAEPSPGEEFIPC